MDSSNRNQTPEQRARDRIDQQLAAAGWVVQGNKAIDFSAGSGIAVREYQTDVGPADYVLFVDRQAVGVIEAKPESWGHKITTVELQSQGYANASLKWVKNQPPNDSHPGIVSFARPALHAGNACRTISANRPAKPLWTPVRTLKSSGFFNAQQKCPPAKRRSAI